MAWAIFLVVSIPLLGFMLWLLLSASFVRIEPGKLGLLLVRGRATDHALLPGPHFVPALRRMDGPGVPVERALVPSGRA
jgi:hypothetical protein